MKVRWSLFLVKLKLSVKTLLWLFSNWRYSVLAIVLAGLFFELVYWLFNLQVLGIILSSTRLSIVEKLSTLLSPFQAIGGVSGRFTLSMMIALSLIQGVSIAALTYSIKNQPKVDNKLLGGSTVVGFLAVVGLGCPACGTSLITPIVALFASGSAVAISENITAIALPLAIAIGLYGLYVLGLRISTIRMQNTD